MARHDPAGTHGRLRHPGRPRDQGQDHRRPLTLLRHGVLLHPRHRRLGLEADDHDAYQRLVDALRETPFWDRYFQVVDLLVGTENGYARTYGVEAVTGIAT